MNINNITFTGATGAFKFVAGLESFVFEAMLLDLTGSFFGGFLELATLDSFLLLATLILFFDDIPSIDTEEDLLILEDLTES